VLRTTGALLFVLFAVCAGASCTKLDEGQIDDHGTPDPADDTPVPSCETDTGRGFLGPAIDAIAALIGRHLPQ
jgi:hypothetical protein